jgi:hypothetical protein
MYSSKSKQIATTVVLTVIASLGNATQSTNGEQTNPPDISLCDKVILKPYPSVTRYVTRRNAKDVGMWNSSEIKLLDSKAELTCTNLSRIAALARVLAQGRFSGVRSGYPRIPYYVLVCGYTNNNRNVSFVWYDWINDVSADNDEWFKYGDSIDLIGTLSPDVHPFLLRAICREHIERLGYILYDYMPNYPNPHVWCDKLSDTIEAIEAKSANIDGPDRENSFLCPSSHTSKQESDSIEEDGSQCCSRRQTHYAINPNCRRDSPGEMVLLFETKPGWNLYGGPELFSLTNHKPKGGCVYFNDGTIRFVRSIKEAKGLRWK